MIKVAAQNSRSRLGFLVKMKFHLKKTLFQSIFIINFYFLLVLAQVMIYLVT